MPHLGEIAALATACCWAMSALAFAGASQRVGSLAVNLIRMVMACLLLTLLAWMVRGRALPLDASPFAWRWLALSGLVGFLFGDLCQFRALVLLGPRLTSLLMSLSSPLAALFGWLLLGEVLHARQLAGMTLTLGGIVWALSDQGDPRRADPVSVPRSWPLAGVLLALGGAVGQGGGLVLSKFAMGGYDALAATQIRVFAGTAGFIALFVVLRRWRRVGAALGHRRAMAYTVLGALFGPVFGVTLSLFAVQHAPTGVAASLMATSPLLILPAIALRGERVGLAGVLGALVAVLGVALLLL